MISCRSQDREEVLAPQNSSASCSHTRSRHRATSASSLQQCSGSTTLSCRIATGNMYLASSRPWGINSRGGERSFTRRCVRQVSRGAPFIGGGGNPKGVAGAWGCPLALPSSCGWTLHSQISFKFPPLKSPLKFPLNFHQIKCKLSLNKTLLFYSEFCQLL